MSDLLLHRENFTSIPVVGLHLADVLKARAGDVMNMNLPPDPDITIAIRTLNEQDELEHLIGDIRRINSVYFNGVVEIVVVDNESHDDTVSVAEEHGAIVVNIPRGEFSHSRALNDSMKAANNGIVMLTPAHVQLSNVMSLRGGVRHFADPKVGGVFARVLPSAKASQTENLIGMGNLLYMKQRDTNKAMLGVLASQGAFVRRSAWEALGGFDEEYAGGGADTALAREMIENDWRVVEDPIVATHHSHGLGPVNYLRQLIHWQRTVQGPQPLDLDQLQHRRPDLNFD